MKIAVMGYSGAGKSTLARALGERYGISVKKWLAEGLENHWDKVTVLRSQKEIDQYLEGLSC